MSSMALIVALLAQAPGAGVGGKVKPARPAPVKPVSTTFEAVQAGRHRAGGAVSFPALVLAATAIQVKTGGRTGYYALAVGPDSAYLTAARAALASLEGPGREGVRRLAGTVDKDAEYRKALDEHIKLTDAAKLKVDPAETLAVELSGFEVRADAYKWETVVDKSPFQPVKLPKFDNPFANMVSSTAQAMERIKKLADRRPPNLDEKMPELSRLRTFGLSKADADAYNAMTQAFNTELKRRRVYAVQAIEEDLLVAVARLTRLMATPPVTLVAAPAARNALAVETLTQIHGAAPRVFVRERAPANGALAKRLFETTSVLVTSYPKGATLTLNGEPKGETPVVLADLVPGAPLDVALSRDGFAPFSAKDTVSPAPEGVKRLEYVLEVPAAP